MTRLRKIQFDWQLIPFGVSALIGLSIAYNKTLAAERFGLILLGLVVYVFCASVRDMPSRSILRTLVVVLPAIITIYFVLTNDWTRSINKLPQMSTLTGWFTMFQIGAGALSINPNVIGGVLAAFLPLQVAALKNSQRTIKVSLISLTLIGLVLTLARGAWLVLALVGGLWLAWRMLNQRIANQRTTRFIWLTGVLIVAVVGGVILFATPLGDRLLGLGGDRTNIWRNSVALIGDYPLSGFGLGSFEMVYSSYALLTHVGHTLHAHNLWLNVWLEQGLLGIIAFAGLVLNAVWPGRNTSAWRMPALAALGVILLHTLIDDAFYGYGGVAIPLLFVPLGLLRRRDRAFAELPNHKLQPAFAIWGAAIGIVLIGLILPGGRALIEANIGAVEQTQSELLLYHWPEYGLQDVVRQTGAANLQPAIQRYESALAIDPGNVTSNRRLGQIKLSLGNIDLACNYLEQAYAAAPHQRASIQLRGECYALHGDVSRAVQLWRTIDLSEGQLMARQWWYGSYLGQPDRAAALAVAMDALDKN